MAEEFDTSPLTWLKRVLETRDEEISCAECQILVSQYVDLELETGEAGAPLPELVHHINQCPACWDTYQLLRELARLEAQGGSPDVQELSERLKRDE